MLAVGVRMVRFRMDSRIAVPRNCRILDVLDVQRVQKRTPRVTSLMMVSQSQDPALLPSPGHLVLLGSSLSPLFPRQHGW